MKIYKRQSMFVELAEDDVLAKEHGFLEVTKWKNGEGFDVEIETKCNSGRYQFTWGQFKALKKLIKKLED
jgi:hypothetical protein